MTAQKGDRKGEKSANKSRRGEILESPGVTPRGLAQKVVENDGSKIEPRTMEEILRNGKKYPKNKIVTKRLLFLQKNPKKVTILRKEGGDQKRTQA